MQRINRNESGNVVIEVTLAISLMCGLLIPAVLSLSQIANAQRRADAIAVEVSRAWTRTALPNRWTVARSLISKWSPASTQPASIRIRCSPACTESLSTVTTDVTVNTGVFWLSRVSSAYSLVADAYAQ